jgi:nucleoside-diphosphate-sugar epimerase
MHSPRYIVSGSSGFIGTHLARELQRSGRRFCGVDRIRAVGTDHPQLVADIRERSALTGLANDADPAVLIHLAAVAEALVPFTELAGLYATNLAGTLNLLEAARPGRVVFASSGSVYGNTPASGTDTDWARLNPLGIYAASKAMGELTCRSWARASEGVAVCLRFGNVVGPGCRGLIPYLVRHAVAHPDGAISPQLRGGGTIMRDYVPVDYVVEAAIAASEIALTPGVPASFNVSSGRGMTNGQIAALVTGVLEREGYRLRPDFGTPVAAEEARFEILEAQSSAAALGIRVRSADEVASAVEAATRHELHRARMVASGAGVVG